MPTLSEALNDRSNTYDIFTCQIIEVYEASSGIYESLAYVKERFYGQPKDTIFLSSTHNSYKIGDKWLIANESGNNLQYHTGPCGKISTKEQQSPRRRENIFSRFEFQIEIIHQYQNITASQTTGYIELGIGEYKMAEGQFINGQPFGKWIHYHWGYPYSSHIKYSEITYKNGLFDGEYVIYSSNADTFIVSKVSLYSNGYLMMEGTSDRISSPSHQFQTNYEYFSDDIFFKHHTFNSTQFGTAHRSSQYCDYSNSGSRIGVMHGEYFRQSALDSNGFFPLGEGRYFMGARVGHWNFFDTQGRIIREETYPDIEDDTTQFVAYDDFGQIEIIGQYENRKRKGIWSFFEDGKKTHEEVYSHSGSMLLRTRYRLDGTTVSQSSFSEGEMHGQQFAYYSDGTPRSIENYENGVKMGTALYFNDDQSLEKEVHYNHGRETTIYPAELGITLKNGLKHGFNTIINPQTGRILEEGHHNRGYKTGLWTAYHLDGRITKSYYSEDPIEIMHEMMIWGVNTPVRVREYDANGILIREPNDNN